MEWSAQIRLSQRLLQVCAGGNRQGARGSLSVDIVTQSRAEMRGDAAQLRWEEMQDLLLDKRRLQKQLQE